MRKTRKAKNFDSFMDCTECVYATYYETFECECYNPGNGGQGYCHDTEVRARSALSRYDVRWKNP